MLILVVQNLLENLQIRGEGFPVARCEVAGLENLHGGRSVARQVIAHDNTAHCGFCLQGVVQPQVKVRLIVRVLIGTREFQQVRPFRALVEQTLRGGLHRRVLHHCGRVHRRALSIVERFEPTIRIAQIDRLIRRRVLLYQVAIGRPNNDNLGILTAAQTVDTSEALCQGRGRRQLGHQVGKVNVNTDFESLGGHDNLHGLITTGAEEAGVFLLQLFQVVRAHASYEKLNLFLCQILSEFLLDGDSRPHMVDDTTNSVGFLGVFTRLTTGKEILDRPHSGIHDRTVTGLAVPLIDGVEHQFLVRVDTLAQLFIIRTVESLNVHAQRD